MLLTAWVPKGYRNSSSEAWGERKTSKGSPKCQKTGDYLFCIVVQWGKIRGWIVAVDCRC